MGDRSADAVRRRPGRLKTSPSCDESLHAKGSVEPGALAVEFVLKLLMQPPRALRKVEGSRRRRRANRGVSLDPHLRGRWGPGGHRTGGLVRGGPDPRFGAMTVAATVFRLLRLALRPRGGGWLPRQSRERPGWDGRVCRSRASASGPAGSPCLLGSAAVSVVGAAAYVGVDGTEER